MATGFRLLSSRPITDSHGVYDLTTKNWPVSTADDVYYGYDAAGRPTYLHYRPVARRRASAC